MYGKNPIRKPVSGDGSMLDVKHMFPTLQGEGPYAGAPSVFVRLGGCNLACSFCDTEFEGFATLALHEVIDRVRELSGGVRKLVVITGGEPLRQNISPLCDALLAEGFQIQVETNGTLYRELPAGVELVCSPKNTGGGYMPVRGDVLARSIALKYIISASDEKYNHVPQSEGNVPVYVQPMDEYDAAKNAANLALAKQLAMAHGYRLSLQLHKILGIE